MNPITFRLATESDIPFLIELRRKTMSAQQVASGVPWSDEECVRRVRVSFDSAQVIVSDGKLVGLLKVVKREQVWELLQIQLVPELQARGIGSTIVNFVVDSARAAGVQLRLSVLKTNPAKRLYERAGFAVVTEKLHAYEMALEA